MWLAFLIGYFGMSIGDAISSYFLKKTIDEWFSSFYWLTCGYAVATGILGFELKE